MAEISKFFNSTPGNPRKYFASDFANYFRKVLSAGLLLDENGEYGLQVTHASGLQTVVAPGEALIKGYSYENTTPLTLAHSLPEMEHDRIDRVVLRLDLRNQNLYIRAFVKEGVAASNPVPPELQRDEYIYELSLAQVILRANTASIDANDITDERAYEDVCGIVQSLVTVPTSVFQQQFDAWFNSRKDYYESIMSDWQSQEQADFDAWFQSIKNILDGDVAANLAARISIVEQDVNAHLVDNALHLQAGERDKWNDNLETAQTLKTEKSNKDSEGIFTTVKTYRKSDNTLYQESVLSGGTPPQYTTRTIKTYDVDGNLKRTDTFTLFYDSDGVLVSEV